MCLPFVFFSSSILPIAMGMLLIGLISTNKNEKGAAALFALIPFFLGLVTLLTGQTKGEDTTTTDLIVTFTIKPC